MNQYNERGQRDGYWEFYGKKGNVEIKGHYHNGLKCGEWLDYFDDGQLFTYTCYEKDMLDGKIIHYWYNGQISYKGQHKKDEPVGFWESYDIDGSIEAQNYFI